MEGYLNNIVNLKLMLYTNIVFYIISAFMLYEILLQLLIHFYHKTYTKVSRKFNSVYYKTIFWSRKDLINCLFNYKRLKNISYIKNQLNYYLGMLICFIFILGIKYTPLYQNGMLQILQFTACTTLFFYFFLFLSNSIIENLNTTKTPLNIQRMKNSIQK